MPKRRLREIHCVCADNLVNLASSEAGMTTLVMTASDGYAVEVSLADVQDCADCLIVIEDGGSLSMVMAEMQSSY